METNNSVCHIAEEKTTYKIKHDSITYYVHYTTYKLFIIYVHGDH